MVKEIKGFFSSLGVKEWSDKDIARDRNVWVQCNGVPFHSLSEDLFQKLVMTRGTIVCLNAATANKHRFDFGRFCGNGLANDVEECKLSEEAEA
ncbi:hypothetical protein RJT34_07405 [Clitoria ternatea]|uniref:Cyclotide n=1 Tax=Clitoria ternatea TaxID=43366 RepID=A0AAN9PS75_CLITE